jgi:hypothetical protein
MSRSAPLKNRFVVDIFFTNNPSLIHEQGESTTKFIDIGSAGIKKILVLLQCSDDGINALIVIMMKHVELLVHGFSPQRHGDTETHGDFFIMEGTEFT